MKWGDKNVLKYDFFKLYQKKKVTMDSSLQS